jgi:hypothetical protein
VAKRFDENNDLGLASQITTELQNRDSPRPPVSAASQNAVDLINEALSGEHAFKQMLYDDWLKLPVTAYDHSTVEDGGIYYDAGLGTPAAAKADRAAAGKTEAIEWQAGKSQGVPARVPLIYIRVGPRAVNDLVAANTALATATDPADIAVKQTEVDAAKALVRSTVYHEYLHLQDYRRLRDPDSTAEQWALAKSTNNSETRTYAIQLHDYGAELTAPQVASLLRMLAKFLPYANDEVQASAVRQIVSGLRTPGADRVLAVEELQAAKRLIAKLSAEEQANLALLAKEIDAELATLVGR